MLGLLDEDLKQVLGIDVEGVFRRRTMFGFENKDWKAWDFNGLEVLVPGMFNTTVGENGDTLIYPQGNLTAEPIRGYRREGVTLPVDKMFMETWILPLKQKPFRVQ